VSEARKINKLMHKLLIENEIDGFTVTELRDHSLKLAVLTTDSVEARKRIYRQILSFEAKEWLSYEGTGRNKRYYVTEKFKAIASVPPRERHPVPKEAVAQDYSILEEERNSYQGELEIILGEVEEYQSLQSRFPELSTVIGSQLERARERSAKLLGKVNALTAAINALSRGIKAC
jgi:hypothetical protein